MFDARPKFNQQTRSLSGENFMKPKIYLTTIRLFVAAFLLCGLLTIQAQAVPGDLDSTFGNGGKVLNA